MERIDDLFSRYQAPVLSVLRIVAALLMMQHGAQKMFGALGGVDGAGASVPLASMMGLAGIIEFFIAGLVAVGLFTRLAAFLLAGEMAAAYFMGHAGQAFWPIANQGELAMLYCFVFLFLAAAGPGPFSLDAILAKKRGGEVETSSISSSLSS